MVFFSRLNSQRVAAWATLGRESVKHAPAAKFETDKYEFVVPVGYFWHFFWSNHFWWSAGLLFNPARTPNLTFTAGSVFQRGEPTAGSCCEVKSINEGASWREAAGKADVYGCWDFFFYSLAGISSWYVNPKHFSRMRNKQTRQPQIALTCICSAKLI